MLLAYFEGGHKGVCCREAFFATFSNSFGNWPIALASNTSNEKGEAQDNTEDLEAIKNKLSDLQEQLDKLKN